MKNSTEQCVSTVMFKKSHSELVNAREDIAERDDRGTVRKISQGSDWNQRGPD